MSERTIQTCLGCGKDTIWEHGSKPCRCYACQQRRDEAQREAGFAGARGSAARFECLKLSAKLDSRAEKCSEQEHQNGEYGNLRHDAEVMRMASKILAREAQQNKDSATCVNCKYWLKQSMASGECRRHAPQVVAYTESQTKGEHGEYRESVDSHTQSEWPVTPAGEWCGEYEPQNESASRSEL